MDLLKKRDRILTLPALEDRMALLEEEIREAERNLSKLLQRYKRESRNLERLEKESFSILLLKLVGKREERLEETKRAEINAKLAYDSAATHINNLKQEKQELTSRITPLKAEEKAFRAELERRRTQITRQLTEPQGTRYTELENEREVIVPQITKLKEALRVATDAFSTAEKIAISLNVNGAITVWNMTSNIENAEQNLHILFPQMRELMIGLRGVHDIQTMKLNEILSTLTNTPFTFSSAYTLRIQVRNKIQEISLILDVLGNIKTELTSKLQEQQDKYTANRREEEELLFSL